MGRGLCYSPRVQNVDEHIDFLFFQRIFALRRDQNLNTSITPCHSA
jgi:hypothetical protein